MTDTANELIAQARKDGVSRTPYGWKVLARALADALEAAEAELDEARGLTAGMATLFQEAVSAGRRAEAAKAENARLREALLDCSEANPWTHAQSVAEKACERFGIRSRS